MAFIASIKRILILSACSGFQCPLESYRYALPLGKGAIHAPDASRWLHVKMGTNGAKRTLLRILICWASSAQVFYVQQIRNTFALKRRRREKKYNRVCTIGLKNSDNVTDMGNGHNSLKAQIVWVKTSHWGGDSTNNICSEVSPTALTDWGGI